MEQISALQEKVYLAIARKSPTIISLFKYLYLPAVLYLAVGDWAVITKSPAATLFAQNGIRFGQAALVLLGIVVLPGILGRLGIEIKLTRIITLFRRQLGITTFILAFTHYQHVRFAQMISTGFNFKLVLFEIFGFSALAIMSLLFLTSNNFSQKKLGKWWKRLHRLIYVILWLLVLHTGLQRISTWSVLILTVASLEIFSLIYSYSKKRRI